MSLTAGAIAAGAGISGAGSILNSVGSSALSWYYAKKAAALQYKYQEKLAKNQPSWNVSGLEKAGLNPMLATHGPAGGGLNVNAPIGGDMKLGAAALEGASAAAGISNVLADKKKKEAEAEAIRTQAKAAERTSKANEWVIWDRKQLKEAGATAYIKVGGKLQSVDSIRINKVTGEAYSTFGNHRIDKMSYTDVPSSAKQTSSPVYQFFKIDGSGFNSTMNAPSMTIPADGMKVLVPSTALQSK